jgi:hypothetical protein
MALSSRTILWSVMAGLVPAIHASLYYAKAWMPGNIGERSDAVLRTAMAGHDDSE